jgi:enamine deaminase RidA (YjgF/YER057c/UK114 family)
MSSIVAGAARRGPGFVVAPQMPRASMSRHRTVNPPELGTASGFSHAVVASGTIVHLAGQLGVGKTIAEQFDSALERLLIALAAAGGRPEDLVSLQAFVTDLAAYKAARREIGQAWQARLGRHYPAMGLFGVSELFEPDALVELMGVAVLPA